MTITEEYSIDIRVTAETTRTAYGHPVEHYGCDIINTDGELIVGLVPEYKTPMAAVKQALTALTQNDLQKAC
ncbi:MULTISPECIES: hypothetical protein [Neisseria]|jgi:hypothetical protein|uniref:hypothetical protein n=1 Tax=Neisseria TaxID=482 RepID=UPI000BB66E97|nr:MULTISPECIES: hypothetical protein [Neisseria]DAF34496.1 MAG TPA: hypothetical protein [Caudoviricetes sp.]